MNIYVGNLSYDCTEDDLRTAFGAYGTVDSARLISDRDTGRPKGFGFVEMSNNNEAQAAINGLNNSQLRDRSITVNEARPREERPARSNYGGGGGGGRRW
jgi:RNA recognition motif-containing protein